MKVTRRDFLKYCVGSAAALGLDMSMLGTLERALANGDAPPIIWLAASNCTGCTVSLANWVTGATAQTDLDELLVNTINLAYHPNLMAAAGDTAVETLHRVEAGDFILAVEGGIPTAFNGYACMLYTENGKDVTALSAVKRLAPKALAVLSIGTCASFGGIPGGAPNPTAIKSVRTVTGVKAIHIPGCPTHPDWIVGTIAQLLAGKTPALDASGRPTAYFGSTVHSRCERRDKAWAMNFGVYGRCMQGLGCKGTATRSDCPSRKWNRGTNWCVGANAICLGCTEKGFPDTFSPFYSSAGALPSDHESVNTSKTCIQCHGSSADD